MSNIHGTALTQSARNAQQPSVAEQLRTLADFIDSNNIADLGFIAHNVMISLCGSDDPRTALATFIRAGLRAGLNVTKELDSSQYGGAKVCFGPRVSIEAFANREQVCERVVVGTDTVVKQVPDPVALQDVPLVEVVEEVERVEWVCRPLLAVEQQPVADLGDVLNGHLAVQS